MIRVTSKTDIPRILARTMERLQPLMDGEPDALLQAVIDHACQLAKAAFAGLIVLGDDDSSYRCFKISGWDSTPTTLPSDHGIFLLPAKTGQTLRIRNVSDHPMSVGTPSNHPPVSAFLGVPLVVHGKSIGCIFLGKPPAGGSFTLHDENLMMAFSSLCAMMITLVDLKDEERLRTIGDERRRIANELHDSLSQTLFVLGNEIDDLANRLNQTELAEVSGLIQRVRHLTKLSQSELRAALFKLTDSSLHPNLTTLRELVDDFQEATGITTQLMTEGDFGKMSLPLRQVVSKVVAESLANVYRHAESPIAIVHVSVGMDEAAVTIQDTGVGISDAALQMMSHPTGHFGLRSMVRNLRDLKGTLQVHRNEDGGTTVQCTVPLRRSME